MKVNIYDLMENFEDSSVRMEENSVVSSERIKELTRMKIQNASNKKRSSKKTILTVGIAVAVVAALGATAFAAINGGLANLSFGKSSWGPSIEEDIKNSVPQREFVSSQGYPDSPEYQATKEWIAFDDSYDREFKILDAFDAETKRTGTDPFAEKYGDYGVYSQEMADKIDEICAKYKLKLHTGCDDADEKILEEKFGVDLFADGVEGPSDVVRVVDVVVHVDVGMDHLLGFGQRFGQGERAYFSRSAVEGGAFLRQEHAVEHAHALRPSGCRVEDGPDGTARDE